MKDKKRGLVHIYTGDGKGKTTAAIGLESALSGMVHESFDAAVLKGMFTQNLLALKISVTIFGIKA